MSAEAVEHYPVLTFASGPTNSMRGAAYLSGAKDAIVVDIGGTTTDIGVLTNGFPRESAIASDVGGVRTNFRMPDIIALGLGGGSLIHGGEPLTVGPDSLGYRLREQSLVFGGNTLTATDIAVAAGQADIGERSRLDGVSREVIEAPWMPSTTRSRSASTDEDQRHAGAPDPRRRGCDPGVAADRRHRSCDHP